MLQYVRMALSPASSLYYRETEMPDPDICDNLPDLVAGYHSSSEAESCPLQQSFTSQPKASRCCDRLVAGQSAAIRRYTVRKESAECALHLQRNSISREIAIQCSGGSQRSTAHWHRHHREIAIQCSGGSSHFAGDAARQHSLFFSNGGIGRGPAGLLQGQVASFPQ